jgi:TM2 domain-containing membrane protein YozV
MKCPKCQTENRQDSKFCISCGESLVTVVPVDEGVRRSPLTKKHAQGKNPVLAAVLCVLITGLGQVYNGDFLKGIVMFVGAVILFVPTAGIGSLAMLVWSVWDAHQVAKGNQSLWK